jgi:hypothetical protein
MVIFIYRHRQEITAFNDAQKCLYKINCRWRFLRIIIYLLYVRREEFQQNTIYYI